MSPIVLEQAVGADGTLLLKLPLGVAEAGKLLRITVESKQDFSIQDGYKAFILSTAGAWQGDFEEIKDELPEERDPLP